MWQNGAEEGTNTEEQTKPQRNRPKSDDGRSTVENTEEGVISWTNEKERQLCQFWREEMHLYDTTAPVYKNRGRPVASHPGVCVCGGGGG